VQDGTDEYEWFGFADIDSIELEFYVRAVRTPQNDVDLVNRVHRNLHFH